MNKMEQLANQGVVFKNIDKITYENGEAFLKELGTSDNEIIRGEIVIYPFKLQTFYSNKENRFLFPYESIGGQFKKLINLVTHSEKDLLDSINGLKLLQKRLGSQEVNNDIYLETEILKITDIKNLHDFKNYLFQNGGIDIVPEYDHTEIILASYKEDEKDPSQYKFIRISSDPEYLRWSYSNDEHLEESKAMFDDVYVIPNVENFDLMHQSIRVGNHKLYMNYFLFDYKDVRDEFPVWIYKGEELVEKFNDLESLLQYTQELLKLEEKEAAKNDTSLKTFSFLQHFGEERIKNKFKLSPIISKSEVLKNGLQLNIPNFLKYAEQKGWNINTIKKEDFSNHITIGLFPYAIHFKYSDVGEMPLIFYPLHVEAWGGDHEIINTHEQLLSFIDSISTFHEGFFDEEEDEHKKEFINSLVTNSNPFNNQNQASNISDDDLPF